MKRRKLHKMMAGLWTLAAVAFGSLSALAADTVEVTGSGSHADSTDVFVGYADKDLFSNMKGLMPGDTISNTITLHNQSSRGITIYLKAYPDFVSGNEEDTAAVREDSLAMADGKAFQEKLLNLTDMTLTLGKQIIYEGSADGKAPEAGYRALTDGDYGISLGYFSVGKKEELTVTLELPGQELGNAFQGTFDAVDWVFCVEGTTPSDNDGPGTGPGNTAGNTPEGPLPIGGDSGSLIITNPGSLPKMGDTGIGIYVLGMFGAALIGCSFLYIRRRYDCN